MASGERVAETRSWLELARDFTTGLELPGLGRDAAETPAGSLVPSSGWRIYTIGSSMPRILPAEYRLQIVGHVERPVTLTLADLRALPRAEQVSDFHCVTGWSVDDVRWGGVRLDDVIAQARPRAGWRSLRFISDEVPYDDSLTQPQALQGRVFFLRSRTAMASPMASPSSAASRW